jgi:hypothetical protein
MQFICVLCGRTKLINNSFDAGVYSDVCSFCRKPKPIESIADLTPKEKAALLKVGDIALGLIGKGDS